MKPPTFPARPVNGGPFDKALPKTGDWFYEPKYNGWRALIHVPAGAMFNRKLQRLTIEPEFKNALAVLKDHCAEFEWADCEALNNRHNVGKGSLILLDVIPVNRSIGNGVVVCDDRYEFRRRWFDTTFPHLFVPRSSATSSFPLVSIPAQVPGTLETWQHLQNMNSQLGCEFFEGLVAKRADSIYPIQLRSPDFEFPFWMKHRWAF